MLLLTPQRLFEVMVPLLLAIGTLLLACSGRVRNWVVRRSGHSTPNRRLSAALIVPVSIYSGYFGAGAGVMLVGVTSLETEDYRQANAMKNVMTLTTTSVATAVYAASGMLNWPAMFLIGLFVSWPFGFLISALLQFEFGSLLSSRSEQIVELLSYGATFGIGFGFLQALYVGKTPRQSFLWMGVNGLAVALALWALFAVWWVRADNYRPLTSIFGHGALAGTAGGAVYGVITGTALIFMLRGHDRFPVKMRY